MRRLPILLGLVGVLIVVGLVGLAALVIGDDDSSNGHSAQSEDPFPENPGFHLGADASPYAGPVPLKVKFSVNPFKNDGDVQYYWRFDDGTTSRDKDPAKVFRENGYYQVLVDAKDKKGNRDRVTLILGAWPADLWATTERRRLTRREQLGAIREQSRATQARRDRLKKAGKPYTGETVPEPNF